MDALISGLLLQHAVRRLRGCRKKEKKEKGCEGIRGVLAPASWVCRDLDISMRAKPGLGVPILLKVGFWCRLKHNSRFLIENNLWTNFRDTGATPQCSGLKITLTLSLFLKNTKI